MSQTMLAARAYPGEATFRLEDVPVPEIGPGEVLVKVAAAGITRGLLSQWRNQRRVQLLPATLGHEGAGTVVAIGPGVRRVKEGDRVRLHPTLTCRDCYWCRTDQETLCPSLAVIGYGVYGADGMALYETYHDGTLAEYLRAPEWTLDHLPDEISFEVGARVHSLASAYRALRKLGPRPGESLVVAAATGASGAAAVKVAPHLGFTRIIAVARSAESLARIKAMDPASIETIAVNDLPTDWAGDDLVTERIKDLTGGQGADCLVDFMPSGSDVTLQALFGLRRGGRAVLCGGNWTPLSIPYGRLMAANYELKGSNGCTRRDATEVMDLLRSDRLDVSALFTHRLALT